MVSNLYYNDWFRYCLYYLEALEIEKNLGVYIYFVSYTAHNIIAVIVETWIVYVLVIPIIGAICLLLHIKKMSLAFT